MSLFHFAREPRGPGRVSVSVPIVLALTLVICSSTVCAQDQRHANTKASDDTGKLSVALSAAPSSGAPPASASVQEVSADDLIRRALSSSLELRAARLEADRARARLRQAGLRPNPTLDFEQQSGVLNSPGESVTTVGVSAPLELGGKRGRRIDLAQAELEIVDAEIADRERRLAADVHAVYVDALAAQRDLEITEGLDRLDMQTVRVVEARVTEGDAAPLELDLLRVELFRLRSRRTLVEGRLQATLLKLKTLAGIPLDHPIRVRGDLSVPLLREPPATPQAAIEIALRSRPDLRAALLAEEAAQAGLRLAKSLSVPDLTIKARYGTSRSTFDNSPVGVLTDRDKLLSVGISIPIPLFNRNQGAKAEAVAMIAQARTRREFVEAALRAEVAGALSRYQAARLALAIFEPGVIVRSQQNIQAVRGAYEIGAFRVTELMAEQRRMLDAQREFTDTLAERYRALSDLEAAMGVITNR